MCYIVYIQIIYIYILIRDGYPLSTFPTHLHLQIHMPTSSLSSYLAASAKSAVILFRQIVTLRGKPCRYCTKFTGLSGNAWEASKIAHESHNDVRRLCWHAGAIFVLLAELGLRKAPSGNTEGLGLLGEGCTFPLLWSSNRPELGETEDRTLWRVGRFCPPPYSEHPRPVAYLLYTLTSNLAPTLK